MVTPRCRLRDRGQASRRRSRPGSAPAAPPPVSDSRAQQVTDGVVRTDRLGHRGVRRSGVELLPRSGRWSPPSSGPRPARRAGPARRPRQAGSREKCRLTQPCRRNRPGPMPAAGHRTPPPGSSPAPARSAGPRSPAPAAGPACNTSIPSSSARSATGLESARLPRPAGASGRVSTATTSCADAAAARPATADATSGVPAKTIAPRECSGPGRARASAHHLGVDPDPQGAVTLPGAPDRHGLLDRPNQFAAARPREPAESAAAGSSSGQVSPGRSTGPRLSVRLGRSDTGQRTRRQPRPAALDGDQLRRRAGNAPRPARPAPARRIRPGPPGPEPAAPAPSSPPPRSPTRRRRPARTRATTFSQRRRASSAARRSARSSSTSVSSSTAPAYPPSAAGSAPGRGDHERRTCPAPSPACDRRWTGALRSTERLCRAPPRSARRRPGRARRRRDPQIGHSQSAWGRPHQPQLTTPAPVRRIAPQTGGARRSAGTGRAPGSSWQTRATR